MIDLTNTTEIAWAKSVVLDLAAEAGARDDLDSDTDRDALLIAADALEKLYRSTSTKRDIIS